MYRAPAALLATILVVAACGEGGGGRSAGTTADAGSRTSATPPAPQRSPDTLAADPAEPLAAASRLTSMGGDGAAPPVLSAGGRTPNELGRIPILEYHLIGDTDTRWMVERGHFRRHLELLYERGYRPITVAELVDAKIELAAGLSPVVVTFDDASPSQFGYVERDGRLEVDPNSAVGIWLDFHARHPDWGNKATFCLLSGAEAGRSFFGDKGIEGQESEWRLAKVRFLADQGFELCNHTLWHANLGNYPDSVVRAQIARGAMAIDSAVSGYQVRTFALPLGVWPKNRELARAGWWRDPRSGRVVRYRHDAVLLVAGGPARSPFDPLFDPYRLPRVQVFDNELEKLLDQLDRTGARYVAGGGRPLLVTQPAGKAGG